MKIVLIFFITVAGQMIPPTLFVNKELPPVPFEDTDDPEFDSPNTNATDSIVDLYDYSGTGEEENDGTKTEDEENDESKLSKGSESILFVDKELSPIEGAEIDTPKTRVSDSISEVVDLYDYSGARNERKDESEIKGEEHDPKSPKRSKIETKHNQPYADKDDSVETLVLPEPLPQASKTHKKGRLRKGPVRFDDRVRIITFEEDPVSDSLSKTPTLVETSTLQTTKSGPAAVYVDPSTRIMVSKPKKKQRSVKRYLKWSVGIVAILAMLTIVSVSIACIIGTIIFVGLPLVVCIVIWALGGVSFILSAVYGCIRG